MKKFAILTVVLALIVPTVILADIELDFAPVGHGPTIGELGLPLSACKLSDGRIAVLDGATRLISIFDGDGFDSSRKLPDEIASEMIGEINSNNLINSPFLLNKLDMVAGEGGEIYFLTDTSIARIDIGGNVVERIGDFTKNDSMITMPISFDVGENGNFYILDKKNCVVEMKPDGKQTKKIGKIGEGRRAVANPTMVWESDGEIIVLDYRTASPFETAEDDDAVNVWSASDGKFIREFASFSSGLPQTHEVFACWTGEVSGNNVYLLDLHPQLGGVKWVIRHFVTDGSFMKTIECEAPLSNPISSAVFDVVDMDGELFILRPFMSSLTSLDDGESYGVPSEETLRSPVSACPKEDGGLYVLESAPAYLHEYDSDGNHIRKVPINTKKHGLPGLELTVGIDVAVNDGSVYVMTGSSVLTLDPEKLEVTDSLDNSMNIDIPAVNIAMSTSRDSINALDTKGNVTIYTDGLPITFSGVGEIEGDFRAFDIATTRRGDILVLVPEKSLIKRFASSGIFKEDIHLEEIDSPSSICVTEKGIIFVTSMTEGKVYTVSDEGKITWKSGEMGSLASTKTAEDYGKSSGMMMYPLRIRTVGDHIAILDFGNYRVQMLVPAEEKEPEKTPAKLEISSETMDFGKKIFYPERIQKVIQIKNTGEEPLEGKVFSSSDKLKVSPSHITDENLVIYASYEFTLADAWSETGDQTITIESNGGSFTITVPSVEVVGKVISMDIGNPTFRVVTVGDERDFETDRAPTIKNSRTYVPLRAMGEVLGAEIGWDDVERVASFSLDGNEVKLWIGTDKATANGLELILENPPIIVDDSTYVPVRFVSENLGAGIGWISETKTVEIMYPKK